MTQEERIKQIALSLAQLRHAYLNLKAGAVVDQQSFADGLIAPSIRRLEAVINGETAPAVEQSTMQAAEAALKRMDARKGEDAGEWADRLAADLAKFKD